MRNLTKASRELFRRTPDECFPSLGVLTKHCLWQQEQSLELWQPPRALSARTVTIDGRLGVGADDDQVYTMNDWSFGQLCRLAGVAKETVNRLTCDTAAKVFGETLPQGSKPLQLYTHGDRLRSIHAASYTRLHNAELLAMVEEYATDFQPPPKGFNGATGLYAGEQDLFVFLIDPTGWVEIDGEAFAPGMFLWNSEVGCRSVGIETFWYQQVCSNHIVWDAVEVVEFTRKHTANVHEALTGIRQIIEALVAKRDARRDGFAKVLRQAMQTTLASDADEAQKLLSQNAIPRAIAREAVEIAMRQGRLTVFSMVDALTRLAGQVVNAGERTELDQKASQLLALAV
jgi:hypothetical protein